MKIFMWLPMRLAAVLLIGGLLSFGEVGATTRTVDNHHDDGSPGSLRYEIGQSNDGDVIWITTSQTIVLSLDQIVISTDLTISAQTGATAIIDADLNSRIFSISSATVTMAGLQLQQGLDDTGGAFESFVSTLELTDCIVTSNSSHSEGGALFLRGGSLTMEDCEISDNSQIFYAEGGAIYSEDTFVNITSCSFSHNGNPDETVGGAIYALRGHLVVYDSEFLANASEGGAAGITLFDASATIATCVFSDGGGFSTGALELEARTTSVTLELLDTKILPHTRSDQCLLNLQTKNSAKFDVLISGCEIRELNQGYSEGLYFDTGGATGSSLVVEHSTFANIGNGSGFGAIQLRPKGATVLFENCDIIDNKGFRGGAVLLQGIFPISNVFFNDCNISRNKALTSGTSGISAAGIAVLGRSNNIYIDGCQFDANASPNGGGAAIGLITANDLLVENSTFSNNISEGNGGAIFVSTEVNCVTIASCTIAGNRSTTASGGAIYSAGPKVLITSSTITGNSAAVSAGAIYLQEGSLTADFTNILSSTSGSSGGAFYINSGGLSMTNSSIRGSRADFGAGGAIYASSFGVPAIDITLIDTEIVTNGCIDRGGAINMVGSGVSLYMDGVHMEDNACSSEGGGVQAYQGQIVATNCTFVNNRAASGTSGGAFYLAIGNFEFHNSTFANNRSNVNGGAIDNFSGTVVIDQCDFHANEAWDGDGGGVLHRGGVMTVTNSTFRNNSASNRGGGFAATGLNADISNCTFSANEAGNLGGGIYGGGAVQLDLKSNTVSANIADSDNNGTGDGGGVWSATGLFKSNIISGNIDRGGQCPDIGNITNSDGFNLIGTVGQYNFNNNTTGDRYGDPNNVVTPNSGAFESATAIDALLAPLADNGGFAPTHAITLNSPAFGTSTTAGVSLVDQRGQARLDVPDIGAFELYVPLEIDMPLTVCLGAPVRTCVAIELPGASYEFEAFNGSVIEDAPGASCATVRINSLAGGSVTLTEHLSLGGVRSTTVTINSIVFAALDHALATPEELIEIDVLANDSGGSLSLVSVGSASMGTVQISTSGTIMYTAGTITGIDRFTYTVTGAQGCVATGNVIVITEAAYTDNLLLGFVEREKDRKSGVRGLRRVNDIVVSPDGRHAYAAGWSDNSIAIFERDSSSGELNYLGRVRHGRNGVTRMRYPAAITISHDGRHVYIAANRDNSIVVFTRNQSSGSLSYLEHHRDGQAGVAGMQRPRDLAISPNGLNIYVSSYNSDAVAVFARDQESGSLKFLESLRDGVDGVDGLNGALGIAVSLDGLSVYVAGQQDNALVQFDRALTDGTLMFNKKYRDGTSGIDGLGGATDLAVSPSTGDVYVAGQYDNAIAHFSRDSATGDLTWKSRLRDGSNGVDGLQRISDLSVSPDGAHLYATGENDNALAVFLRDLNSGELTFADHARDGTAGVDGLRQARAVAVSGDSKHIYVTGRGDNALAVFDKIIFPTGEDRIEYRSPGQSSILMSFSINHPAGLPVTLDSLTDGNFGSTSELFAFTIRPTLTLILLRYTVHTDSVPDAFTYTLANSNGTRTYTVQILESVNKSGGANVNPIVDTFIKADRLDVLVSPNPAQHEVNISFGLEEAASVSINIYDIQGRVVAQIPTRELARGEHQILWQLQSQTGTGLPQGAYIIDVHSHSQQEQELSGQTMLKVIR